MLKPSVSSQNLKGYVGDFQVYIRTGYDRLC